MNPSLVWTCPVNSWDLGPSFCPVHALHVLGVVHAQTISKGRGLCEGSLVVVGWKLIKCWHPSGLENDARSPLKFVCSYPGLLYIIRCLITTGVKGRRGVSVIFNIVQRWHFSSVASCSCHVHHSHCKLVTRKILVMVKRSTSKRKFTR